MGISVGRLGWTLAGAGLIVAASLSPRVVPYNMDEFVHYHALGCATAPLAVGLPAFRDGCGLYDLRLPFTTTPLPLRSYYYIGSIPSVPFYPFWRVFAGPIAARIQGAVFLLVWVGLARALLRVRLSSLALAALAFPVLSVTFLVDEGPVGLSAVCLVGGLLAVRRAIESAGVRAVAWGTVAGLALFLGIWVKLVFAWWLPAVAAWALWAARESHGSTVGGLRRASPALVAAFGALVLPTAFLLGSVDRDGNTYAAALGHGRVSTAPDEVSAGAGRLVRYAVDGSFVAPRNVAWPHSPIDASPGALASSILILGAWRGARRRLEVRGWGLLAVATFGLASLSAYSQWPHHFAFPFILAVFALGVAVDNLGQPTRWACGLLILTYWITLGVRSSGVVFAAESSPDKDRLLAFVEQQGLDKDTLQVHATWGTYYIAQLFGDRARMVVSIRGLSDDPRHLRLVHDLAADRGRPILIVSGRRWTRLLTPSLEETLGPPEHRWQFGEWRLVLIPTPRDRSRPATLGAAGARSQSP